ETARRDLREGAHLAALCRRRWPSHYGSEPRVIDAGCRGAAEAGRDRSSGLDACPASQWQPLGTTRGEYSPTAEGSYSDSSVASSTPCLSHVETPVGTTYHGGSPFAPRPRARWGR